MVHLKLPYAAPVWANTLQNHAIQRRLFSAQRSVALRIVSAYITISTSAVLVLASVPPIDLLAEERQEIFQLRKELTLTDLQEIARAKEAIRKDGRRRLVEKWQMRWHGEQTRRWTYHLIPELATWLNREHGEVGFYLAQELSGHSCFKAYLRRFKKRDEEMCEVGPVEIASGPASAVLRLGRTWLSASFGREFFLFLPSLARLVGFA